MSRAIRASREQQFLLPPSMDDWLPSSHPVRFVADLVEELDLEGLGFHQSVEANEQSPEPDWKMPEAMQSATERKKRIREALAQLDAAEVDHQHPQEPEARVMKTREGLRLGYNAQIVVDHDSDLIVATEVVTDVTDPAQL